MRLNIRTFRSQLTPYQVLSGHHPTPLSLRSTKTASSALSYEAQRQESRADHIQARSKKLIRKTIQKPPEKSAECEL